LNLMQTMLGDGPGGRFSTSPRRRPSRRRWMSPAGQALIETLLTASFVFLLMFGLGQLTLLSVTKSMVNLSAFSAARTAMVRGSRAPAVDLSPPAGFAIGANEIQAGAPAAYGVVRSLRWWQDDSRNRPDLPLGLAAREGRLGLTVTYRVPIGFPIFPNGSSAGLAVTAFSPFEIQRDIPEVGDNGRR
jgi:hypothetical protein